MSEIARAPSRPIRRVLAANRGEIAIRIFRAATELGMGTVAIYSAEDRLSLHRYKADEAYLVGKGKGPVEAYLGIDEIIALAREKEVDAIHPGYGFLSENAEFAERVEAAGLVFVGPTAEQQRRLGDKVAGRRAALEVGVPVVPGTEGPVEHEEEALVFARAHGYPLIVKAAGGGGGRGMRVARDRRELLEGLASARSEARAAFGNATVFIERYIEQSEAHRGAAPRRRARQPRPLLRARLLHPAPPPEGGRARAGARARSGAAGPDLPGGAEGRGPGAVPLAPGPASSCSTGKGASTSSR